MNPQAHPDADTNGNQLRELLSRLLKKRGQLAAALGLSLVEFLGTEVTCNFR